MSEKSEKRFKLSAEEIAPIAVGLGGSLATDRIVVDGQRVGYMCKEKPINDLDSGWRFFAGDETDQYMEDDQNHGVYDVNTIANYDPDILPFLREPVGSCFERNAAGKLVMIGLDN